MSIEESAASEVQSTNPLTLLQQLRNDYIDTIPQNALETSDEDYRIHKCRTGFFVLVGDVIKDLIRDEILTDEQSVKAQRKYEQYREKDCIFKKDSPLGPTFRTNRDIRYVNAVLDLFISKLSAVMDE